MSSPVRARTLRRQRRQLADREAKDLRGQLATTGVYERCARVNGFIGPGSAVFWKLYKGRVSAREFLSPITKVVEARDIAVKVLADLGVDLAGISLKATWRPPEMVFEAVPAYEVAMEAIAAVKESERGKTRAAKLEQITKAEARR
jgi:hypothetical protein